MTARRFGYALIIAATICCGGSNDTTSVDSGGDGGGGGGAQVTPLFFSDWRTVAAGTTGSNDGGKWSGVVGLVNGTVIDAPAGWPTHKALRVASADGVRDGAYILGKEGLGEMAVGSTRNWRWYYAAFMPHDRGGNPGQHPIEDGNPQMNWYLATNNYGGNLQPGEWGVQFNFPGTNSPNYRWGMWTLDNLNNPVFTPKLPKGIPYRFEIQLARVSTTQFRAHIWITDPAGNLVGSDANIRNENGSLLLSSNPLLTFQQVDNTGRFFAGLNGISPDRPITWPIHHNDQGAFAIVDGLPEGQQIGAYGRVVGEVLR